MKVQLDVLDLQRVVSQAGLSVNKGSVNPMFQSVLLRTKKDMFQAVGNSLETSTVGTVRADVGAQGASVVSYALFASTVNKLNPGKVLLEIKQGSLEVRTKKGRYKFRSADPADYPEVHRVPKENRFVIPRDEFVKAIKSVSISLADEPSSRAELKSIRAQWSSSGFRATASDGIRLSSAVDPIVSAKGLGQDVLIPGTGAQTLIGILSALSESTVNVAFGERLFAWVPGASCSIQLGRNEDKKVDFSSFFQEPATVYEVDREELQQAFKRALLFGHNAICDCSPGKIVISVEGSDAGAQEELEVKGGGKLRVKVAAKPFAEGLATMRSDRVRFGGQDLKLVSVRDATVLHGVMPIAIR